MDELDWKLSNIADKRDPDDLRNLEEKLKKEQESLSDKIQPWEEENDYDFSDNTFEHKDEQKKMDSLHEYPIFKTSDQYRKKAHEFLKDVYYEKEDFDSELKYDYETISWYHTLLPVKLYRALSGIYGEDEEADSEMRFYSLCDAIAQFAICKKAIKASDNALSNIAHKNESLHSSIRDLQVILQNLASRISMMEEQI